MLKTLWFWKLLLTYLASVLIFTNFVASPLDVLDFSNIELPKQLTSGPSEETGTEDPRSGIKAAVYAVIASAFLFILLIPQDIKPSERRKSVTVDFTTRVAAALAAFGAGYSWLADATEQHHIQYFQAFGSLSLLFLFAITVYIALGALLVYLIVVLVDFIRRWFRGGQPDRSNWPIRRQRPPMELPTPPGYGPYIWLGIIVAIGVIGLARIKWGKRRD